MTDPAGFALEVIAVTKRFAGTVALTAAGLRVRKGTIHALVGGNGSGKSTLVKVLAGVDAADSGEVRVTGRTWSATAGTPRLAYEAGLRFVHQDLGLFDRMTVAENVALGAGFPTRPGGGVRWRRLHERIADLLRLYEIDARPTAPVSALGPADRTMVAVARALQDDTSGGLVLVLDEPTASLPEHESRLLMRTLRGRADLGQTIVLVSHRLREVREVADDVTVLRDGRVSASIVGRTASEGELVAHIVGRTVREAAPSSTVVGPPALTVRGLRAGRLAGVDLTVHSGEIVGIAGLSGSGRSTLLRAIFGAVPVDDGTVLYGGRYCHGRSTRALVRDGMALVPPDRLGQAAFPDMTVRDNAGAAAPARHWSVRGFHQRSDRAETRRLLERFAIAAPGTEAPFAALSGGNQQKVVLARWLRQRPRLLLLDEPTQGVDVLARADVHASVRAAAASGCAVLLASSDHEELAALCHRILVLTDGLVTAELDGSSTTPDRITRFTQYARDASEDRS